MTNNEMPVVGERYRKIPSYTNQPEFICKIVREGQGTFGTRYVFVEEEGSLENGFAVSELDFFDLFEPIPQDPISQPEKEERLPKAEEEKQFSYLGKGLGSIFTLNDRLAQDYAHGEEEELSKAEYFDELKGAADLLQRLIVGIENAVEIKSGKFRQETSIKEGLERFEKENGLLPAWAIQLIHKLSKERQGALSDEVREAMDMLNYHLVGCDPELYPNSEYKKESYELSLNINRLREAGGRVLKRLGYLEESNILGWDNIPEKGNCGIKKSQKKHPIQPIILDDNGVARFKENKIVSYLLDKATEAEICGLNEIAILVAQGAFNEEDRIQLTQLIGYSVGGAADLSYMPKEIIDEADRQVEEDCELEQAADEWNTEILEKKDWSAKCCLCKSTENLILCIADKEADNKVLCQKCWRNNQVEEEKKSEEEKLKSTWRDVSELPIFHCQVFVKFKNHRQIFLYDCDGKNLMDYNRDELDLEYVESFAILNDFINHIDSLEQRINKLENK